MSSDRPTYDSTAKGSTGRQDVSVGHGIKWCGWGLSLVTQVLTPRSRKQAARAPDARRWEDPIERDLELVAVLWRRLGQHVFLTYARGEREHMEGDLKFATALAEDAGLRVLQSSPAMTHWVIDPESWRLEGWS